MTGDRLVHRAGSGFYRSVPQTACLLAGPVQRR